MPLNQIDKSFNTPGFSSTKEERDAYFNALPKEQRVSSWAKTTLVSVIIVFGVLLSTLLTVMVIVFINDILHAMN